MAQGRSIGFTFYANDDRFVLIARRMADSLAQIKTESEKAGKSLDGMNRVLDQTEKKTTRATGRRGGPAGAAADPMGSRFRDWAAGLGRRAFGAAAAYASVQTLRSMLNEASTVEDAVNKVMSLIRDPADQAAYQAKIVGIIRDNQRLGLSVATLGDTLSEQVATLGTGKDSFEAYSAAVKLSIAAFQPLDSAVASVNKLVDAFPALRGNGALAAQMLFSARQLTNDYPGLLAGLPQVAPLASTAGMSPAKMLALFTVLADETKSAGAASTVEADLLRTLGTKGTPKQTALLKQMSVLTAAGAPNGSFETQLARLRFVAQRNPQAASAIGLSEPTQKALLTMSDEDIKRVARAEGMIRVDASRGTIDQSFNRVQASTTAEMAKTTQALAELSSVIGKDLAPSVRTIAETLRTWNLGQGQRVDDLLGLKPGASTADVIAAIGAFGRRGPASGASGLDSGANPAKGN